MKKFHRKESSKLSISNVSESIGLYKRCQRLMLNLYNLEPSIGKEIYEEYETTGVTEGQTNLSCNLFVRSKSVLK